jgi:hypothetical protein
MATALQILKNSLIDKKNLLKIKEDKLISEKNDSKILNDLATKNKVDKDGSNSACTQENKNKGYRNWFLKRNEVPAGDIALLIPGWTEMLLCNESTSRKYKNVSDSIVAWETRKNNLISEINSLNKEIGNIEQKIKDYENSAIGKKERDIVKIKENTDNQISIIKAQTDAIKLQEKLSQEKIEENKASTRKIVITILIIAISLILVGGIFWYIKKRRENKK